VIFRSPHPDFTVPDVSFSDFLLTRCHEHADAPAFVDGLSGRVVTFRQLAETAERFAAGLAADGLGPGDVVAVLSPNIPEYAAVLIGVLHAGCRVTTINALFTADEVHYQLADCGARLIVTVPELATDGWGDRAW